MIKEQNYHKKAKRRFFLCVKSGIQIKKHKRLKPYIFLKTAVKKLRRKPTKSEIIFEEKLRSLEMRFIPQYPIRYEGFMLIIDFYLHRLKIAIEVDGGYHLTEDQRQKDRIKDFILGKKRISVLRLTNDEAESINNENLLQKIQDIYLEKKSQKFGTNKVMDERLCPDRNVEKGRISLGEEGSLPESSHYPNACKEVFGRLDDSQERVTTGATLWNS